MSRIIVVGAGISGVTAAIELKTRGHDVVLVDPGPLPHPLAASTDISKAVRAAYGADGEYTELAERSIKIWREWNQEFGTQLYHEVGVMFVRRRELKPGDFEYESFKTLEHRGHKVERINSARSWKRFPAWNPELYLDGVLELEAGYAESGRVVATLIRRAKSLGVQLREGKFAALDEKGERVKGIVLEDKVIPSEAKRRRGIPRHDPKLTQRDPSSQRPARLSPAASATRTVRARMFPGFRRRHYNHRLLRISNQSRWRDKDRKSWSGPRDVAGISETRCHSRG